MKWTNGAIAAGWLAGMFLAGCTTAPATPNGQDALRDASASAMTRMEQRDPDLQAFLDKAYGYVIFPSVGKGGLVFGGAYGRGMVYQQDQWVGYADITEGTFGAQAGGQNYSELIAFETPLALEDFEAGQLAFTADASAVAIQAGAAVSAKYQGGVSVFVDPMGGLMAEAVVGGQHFSYQPK
jgi:lipid-binding SYLF domain-containing protein